MPIGISLSDYQDSFVRELQSSSVDFLVLGGMAMRAHGLDRATRDLDLFVDRSRANAERLLPVIARRFRTPPAELTLEWLCSPDKIVLLPGNAENEIDVVTSFGALDFRSASAQRIEVKYQTLALPVLGLRELIYTKIVAVDRKQHTPAIERDMLDLAALLQLWQAQRSSRAQRLLRE